MGRSCGNRMIRPKTGPNHPGPGPVAMSYCIRRPQSYDRVRATPSPSADCSLTPDQRLRCDRERLVIASATLIGRTPRVGRHGTRAHHVIRFSRLAASNWTKHRSLMTPLRPSRAPPSSESAGQVSSVYTFV